MKFSANHQRYTMLCYFPSYIMCVHAFTEFQLRTSFTTSVGDPHSSSDGVVRGGTCFLCALRFP